MKGQKIGGRFQIIKPIGGGSFGRTYLACDIHKFNKRCVVKELNTTVSQKPEIFEIVLKNFKKEAKILDELSHIHSEIPYLIAYFQENNQFYLVEEYIEGHDLARELIPKQKLSESEVIILLEDILKPLSFLHERKIIHRDIKPSNLMRRKSDNKIVVIDFGAIKELAATEMFDRFGKTKMGTIIGTPGYMPSEQALGKARFASDVYAVGSIGIQALTGLMPHEIEANVESGELEWQHLASVSSPFQVILEKMVKYHFQYRYANATEALVEIQKLKTAKFGQNEPKKENEPRQKERQKSRDSVIPISVNSSNKFSRIKSRFNNTFIRKNSENKHGLTLIMPTLNKPVTRRNLIKTAGFTGTGLFLAIVSKSLFNSPSNTTNRINSQPLKVESIIEQSTLKSNDFSFEVITVNHKAEAMDRIVKEAKSFREDLGNKITLEMVIIPEGKFSMGSPQNERLRKSNESPQHLVEIQSFALSKFQITQAQWRAVAALPKIKYDLDPNPSYFKGDLKPVDRISWYDAIEFAARLSQKTQRKYRLPSEAEWEYACRARTSTPFNFGHTISGDLANYDAAHLYHGEKLGHASNGTVEVGNFSPNAFGLYDMHGNVFEWCADTWSNDYYNTPVDGSSHENGDRNFRVLRGGSWASDALSCRSAYREPRNPTLKYQTIGLRLACDYV
ncbi:MAG: SUMF1/EgtB/PvdO family nonheme iron enzyme [Prochloraceae cyanobacterium]